MTSAPTDRGGQRRLLAIDIEPLESGPADGWFRLGDRLAPIRSETTLVFIGAGTLTGLPDPDYVIDAEVGRITRLPGGEQVEGWPSRAGDDLTDAVAYLSEALLIPQSQVFCVLGPDHPRPRGAEQVVVIGGSAPPDSGEWLTTSDEQKLIEILERLHLFGGAHVATADICELAFAAARDTLTRNITDLGFTAASPTDNRFGSTDGNYAAVWARDGILTGLWTLCLDDDELVQAFRRTIRTLAKHQTPSGLIPSNVRLRGEEPDYSGIGGIASIDSVTWFVIGAIRLAFHTGDRSLATEVLGPVERAMTWLAAHDANNDGLIEIPESSDWMDIFPRSYNVLYDEVLWRQACLDTASLLEGLGRDGGPWRESAERVTRAILDQFWPSGDQLMEIAGTQSGRFSPGEAYYLLSQITPFDYGWRCDVYANLLAGLAGLLDQHKLARLFTFLWGVGVSSPFPVTCLYPPITSGADDWKDYFLVNFLNIPDHYHNGGIWPFIGGLWVRFLAAIGRVELAHLELANLAEACRLGMSSEWEFNEWLHGRTGRPMGKAHQAWSAASYVNAHLTLYGDAPPQVFPTLDPSAISV